MGKEIMNLSFRANPAKRSEVGGVEESHATKFVERILRFYRLSSVRSLHALRLVGMTVIFLFISFFPFIKPIYAATLWQYQCIDTMKISRDKARTWAQKTDLKAHIDWEMQKIKDTGANCVAIDTPYDEEFMPYLQTWVQSAREHNLHVWFRGNFSGWEGWFDYPKGMSGKNLLEKTGTFIKKHADLFADGDRFTAAPEAENGGPFNQVEPDTYNFYKTFLITEYQTTKQAFADIDKEIETNWLSMNGGLARRMLDQKTIDALNGVVTIDHYIKTPQEMSEYVQYFSKTYHGRVMVGEFGAPIPDINGPMTEHEQAVFVDLVLQELYKQNQSVIGVNYWDLFDGSTALINIDGSPREAVQKLKNYFAPVVINGQVHNTLGEPLEHVPVKTADGVYTKLTDDEGKYQIIIPANYETAVAIGNSVYKPVVKHIRGNNSDILKQIIILEPKKPTILYLAQLRLQKFTKRVFSFLHHE